MSAQSRSYRSLFYSDGTASHDKTPSRPFAAPSLPSGPCNYRDIALGRHASNCGCQRFWAVEPSARAHERASSLLGSAGAENSWCFCGHHACYHLGHQAGEPDPEPMQDVQRPNAPRESSSTPVRSHRAPSSKATPISRGRHGILGHAVGRRPSTRPANPSSVQAVQGTLSPARNTSFRHEQSAQLRSAPSSALGLYIEHGSKLHSHGQQHLLGASLPSTRCPSQSVNEVEPDAIRPGPSRMATAAQSARELAMPGLEIPDPAAQPNPEDLAQSATEVATPSNAGTPALRGAEDAFQSLRAGVHDLARDLNAFQSPMARHLYPEGPCLPNATPTGPSQQTRDRFASPVAPNGDWNSAAVTQLISQIASLRHALARTPSVAASLRGLNSRVDALENVSFAQPSIDELQDKFEFFDGRLLELEGKMEDLERFRLDNERNNSQASFLPWTRSPNDLSTDAERVASREAAIDRLQSIEAKLIGLEALHGPSQAQPWRVEVVLLPWGKDMQGLWMDPEASDRVSAPTQGSQSQPEPRQSTAAPATNSSGPSLPLGFDEWSRCVDDWRVPRACGPASGVSGRVYERLKSRGLVRAVTFTEQSARHIHATVCATFGGVLSLIEKPQTQDEPPRDSRQTPDGPLLAFRSPFIPLRRLHKSSRLRFLSEAELLTPSLWTASFLSASVFMKAPRAGATRLFITTPSAYFQSSADIGWTWQRLRELPRVSPHDLSSNDASHPSTGVDEADAREPCWEWDARLDPHRSAQTSFASSASFNKQAQNASFRSTHPLSPQPTDVKDGEEPDEASGSGFFSEAGDDEADEAPGAVDAQSTSGHPAPITPVTEFPPSHQSVAGRRTVSLPASDMAALAQSDAETKRQAMSFDAVAGSKHRPAVALDDDLTTLQKRRRITLDPSDEQRAESAASARTSRRSLEAHNAAPAETVGVKSPRDPAQHAYATPHSWTGRKGHAHAAPDDDVEMEMSSDADGDYDDDAPRDSDFDSSSESDEELDYALTRDEEGWEGVGDLGGLPASSNASDASDDDDDDDDDNDDDDDDGDMEGLESDDY